MARREKDRARDAFRFAIGGSVVRRMGAGVARCRYITIAASRGSSRRASAWCRVCRCLEATAFDAGAESSRGTIGLTVGADVRFRGEPAHADRGDGARTPHRARSNLNEGQQVRLARPCRESASAFASASDGGRFTDRGAGV